jgi:hypothetical protein
MPECPHCQTPYQPGNRYCKKCGNFLQTEENEASCPQCGLRVSSQQTHCHECNAPLKPGMEEAKPAEATPEAAPEAPAEEAPSPPEAATPPEVAPPAEEAPPEAAPTPEAGPTPEAAPPEAAAPEAVAPEAVAPEAVAPEAVAPEAAPPSEAPPEVAPKPVPAEVPVPAPTPPLAAAAAPPPPQKVVTPEAPPKCKCTWVTWVSVAVGAVIAAAVILLTYFFLQGTFEPSVTVQGPPPPAVSPTPAPAPRPAPLPEPSVQPEPPSPPAAPVPVELQAQMQKILSALRDAQMRKDISLYMSNFSLTSPDLEARRARTQRIWQNYDYLSLNFTLADIKSLNAENASARVIWNIKARFRANMSEETSNPSFRVWFAKENGQWRIRRVEEIK